MNDPLLSICSRISMYFVFSFLALCVEIWAAGHGWVFPAAVLIGLYLGVGHGWRMGLFWSVATGLVAGIVLGQNGVAVLLLVPLQWAAYQWREHADRASIPYHMAGGMVAGSIYGGVVLLLNNLAFGPMELLLPVIPLAGKLLAGLFLCLIAFPLLILFFDVLAKNMDHEQFRYRRIRKHGELRA